MFTEDVIAEIKAVAREFDFEPAALLAIAEVESGGAAFAIVDRRPEPLIRFEGHYFDRRLSGEKLARARAEALASPNAGAIVNPRSQTERWKLLRRAVAIDRRAAHESVSWGLGQVMGAHWAWLGFAEVEALVSEARSGVAGQVRLMARYLVKAGLSAAIRSRDWAVFARGYNGPAYRRNAYDRKLAAAYRRHARSDARNEIVERHIVEHAAALRQGVSGEAVRDLQTSLSALGRRLPSHSRETLERAVEDSATLKQACLVSWTCRDASVKSFELSIETKSRAMSRKTEKLLSLLDGQPVIPVLRITNVADAVPLARALAAGGLRAIEITLRTPDALEAIRRAANEVEDAIVGAGTILNARQFDEAAAAGSKFIVSPGLTKELVSAANGSDVPLLPGAITPGEIMTAREAGLDFLKFFPAEQAGGASFLKALASPIADVKFCPTGGVTAKNARDYLSLPNVVCVGGSWVAPDEMVRDGKWDAIEALAREASRLRA